MVLLYLACRKQEEKHRIYKNCHQTTDGKEFIPPLNNSRMRIHDSRHVRIQKRNKSSNPTFGISIESIVKLQRQYKIYALV